MLALSPVTFYFPDPCRLSPLQLILPPAFRFLCKHVQHCLDLCDVITLSRVSRHALRSTLAQIVAQAALTTADIEKLQSPEMRADPDLWSNELSTYLLHPPSTPPPPPLSLCELLRALATHVDRNVHLRVDSPGLLQFSYKLQRFGPTHIQIVNGVLQPRNPLYEARGCCDTYQTWFVPSEDPEGKCVSQMDSSVDTRQQITQRFARCMHPELEARELLSAGLMASLNELLPPADYSLVLVQRRPQVDTPYGHKYRWTANGKVLCFINMLRPDKTVLPQLCPILATQTHLDTARVQYYQGMLRRTREKLCGCRPTVMLLEVQPLFDRYSCMFVLDGHHKLASAIKMRPCPRLNFLVIRAQDLRTSYVRQFPSPENCDTRGSASAENAHMLSLSKRVDLAVATAKLVARNDEMDRKARRKYAWCAFQDTVRSLGKQILQSRKNAEVWDLKCPSPSCGQLLDRITTIEYARLQPPGGFVCSDCKEKIGDGGHKKNLHDMMMATNLVACQRCPSYLCNSCAFDAVVVDEDKADDKLPVGTLMSNDCDW